MSQQGTEKIIFRVIFRIGFGIMTAMTLQIPFPDSASFKLKVLIAECVTYSSHEKICVECFSKEQRRAFAELSFELALAL